jgi:hypothetical protein
MSKITSIRRLDTHEQYVYDPACETPHTYIANGMVNHNCELWIDEVEKSLSGTKSSNFSDGGTLARVFGTLLTRMQEGLAGVTVVATANDITALPPEFVRRFNEVFFVDLPFASEREEIFKIHLAKRKRDIVKLKIDLTAVVNASEKYTGAEIEKAVKQAIAITWEEGKRELTTDDLIKAIQETKPLHTVMGEKITVMRDWARERARYASSIAASKAAPCAQEVATSSGKVMKLDDALNDIPEISTGKVQSNSTTRGMAGRVKSITEKE